MDEDTKPVFREENSTPDPEFSPSRGLFSSIVRRRKTASYNVTPITISKVQASRYQILPKNYNTVQEAFDSPPEIKVYHTPPAPRRVFNIPEECSNTLPRRSRHVRRELHIQGQTSRPQDIRQIQDQSLRQQDIREIQVQSLRQQDIREIQDQSLRQQDIRQFPDQSLSRKLMCKLQDQSRPERVIPIIQDQSTSRKASADSYDAYLEHEVLFDGANSEYYNSPYVEFPNNYPVATADVTYDNSSNSFNLNKFPLDDSLKCSSTNNFLTEPETESSLHPSLSSPDLLELPTNPGLRNVHSSPKLCLPADEEDTSENTGLSNDINKFKSLLKRSLSAREKKQNRKKSSVVNQELNDANLKADSAGFIAYSTASLGRPIKKLRDLNIQDNIRQCKAWLMTGDCLIYGIIM